MEGNDLNGLLGSLLSDPKAMESIKQVAETLKASGGPSAEAAKRQGDEKGGDAEKKDTPPALPTPKSGGKNKTSELTALLTAVKPFVSKEKGRTVDDAIGILRLIGLSGQTDLLKSLGGLLR
ncbi:MAG: hypothetical protein E7655_03060 [Ruminococcaceae bacterium]|nr:hypothetical protein [Oscillospiraceae bacterium]